MGAPAIDDDARNDTVEKGKGEIDVLHPLAMIGEFEFLSPMVSYLENQFSHCARLRALYSISAGGGKW